MVKRIQKSKILLGASVHAITDFYSSFIVGMIPIFTVKLGLSLFLVSTLTAVNFISANLSQPLFGYLSDKYGMKRFLVLGPLMASVFISLLGITSTYWVILICLFLGNLGVAATHPPTAAIATYFGGPRRGFANAIISFGGAFGFSLGSIFIIFIIEKLGLAFTPLASVPGILTAAVILKFTPDIGISTQLAGPASFFDKLKKVRRPKIILLTMIILIAYFRETTGIALLTFIPLYLTDRGVELLNFGYIFMAFIIVGGLGGLAAGFYSDRIQKRHIVLQILIFSALPCLYAIFIFPVNISIVFFILYGLFSVATIPLSNRLAQDIFPKNAALATSFSIGVATGSASATVLLIGKIADILGIITTLRYVMILPVISVILLFFYPVVKARIR